MRLDRHAQSGNPVGFDEASQVVESTGFKFDSKHNVWAVGKIMHDMITLAYWDLLNAQMDDRHHKSYWVDVAPGTVFPPMDSDEVYSPDLLGLVRECLTVIIAERLDPTELLGRIVDHMKGSKPIKRKRAEDDEGEREDRVYYRGNEINQLAPGDAEDNIVYVPGDWEDLVLKDIDRTLEPLRPPMEFRRLAEDHFRHANVRLPQELRAWPKYHQTGKFVFRGSHSPRDETPPQAPHSSGRSEPQPSNAGAREASSPPKPTPTPRYNQLIRARKSELEGMLRKKDIDPKQVGKTKKDYARRIIDEYRQANGEAAATWPADQPLQTLAGNRARRH